MEKMIVEATVPEKKDAQGNVIQPQIGPYKITVQTGETAEEMIKMFGDKAVKTNAEANWTVTLQSAMRSRMKKGMTLEQIQAELSSAKMGVAVKGAKVDPIQAYLAMFQNATPEKQKEMLAELRAKASAR